MVKNSVFCSSFEEFAEELIQDETIENNLQCPLITASGRCGHIYFTDESGDKYNKIIGLLIKRKRGKVEADGLKCFEFDHNVQGQFINDMEELKEYIKIEFEYWWIKNYEKRYGKLTNDYE